MDNCACEKSECDKEKECDCHRDQKTPEQKVDDLRQAIEELGFKTEQTEDGIRISI